MAVRESLELDLAGAIASVDKIGEALAAAVAAFRTDLTDALGSQAVAVTVDSAGIVSGIDDAVSSAEAVVSVSADADGITESIDEAVASADPQLSLFDVDTSGITESVQLALFDADTVVPVDADASGVTDAVEAAVKESDATITPEVDTSSIKEGLSESGDAAKEAGKQFQDASSKLTDVASGATSSATSVGALAGSVAGMAKSVPVLGAVAAGVAGIVAFADKAFESAVQVQAGLLREKQAFGDLSDEVERVNVGNLDTSLADLNLTLGSTTTQTRQALATLGQLGASAGAPREEVAKTADQVAALAARAVALNPALGSVGDVTEALTTRLARGGRFAQIYNIALSQQEIKARAVSDANGDLSAANDRYRLTAAAAALATEKYGDTLQQSIAQGAQNPVIQLRQLETQTKKVVAEVGAPLVAPVFDILREAQPVLGSAIQLVGSLARAGLPGVAAASKAAAPGIIALTSAINPLIISVTPLVTELGKLAGTMSLLALLGGAVSRVTGSSAAAADSQGGLQKAIDRTTGSLTDTVAATDDAAVAAGNSAGQYDKLQGALLGVVDGEKGYRDALQGTDSAQHDAEQAARGVVDAHRTQQQAVRGVVDAQRGVEQAQRAAADSSKAYEASVRSVADAERQRESATRSAADAQRQLEEAQRALTAAQAGPSERDQLSVDQARLDLQEAQAEALKESGDAEADAATKERARIRERSAALDLAEAEAKVAGRVRDAQEGLATAQDRAADAQRAVERSQQGVADAHDGVANAAVRVRDAQQGIADVGQKVIDAQDGVAAASTRVRDAESEAVKSTQKVADARDNAARAAVSLSDARTAFAQAEGDGTQDADALLQHLEDLKAAFPEVAPQLDPLINKFRELRDTVPAQAGADSGQAYADALAQTVGASGPQLQTATQQAGAGLDFTGLKDNFVGGLDVVRQGIADKATQFKDTVLGWIDTAAAEGPGKLAFLSGEFAGWAARTVIDLPGNLAGAADAAVAWIDQAVLLAPGKFAEFTVTAFNFAKGIPGVIVGAIGSGASLLVNVGRDIIKGLLGGIIEVVQKLPEFLGPIKDKFVDGFRDAFDSHSPARIMEPVGRDIGAGVIVGLSSSADQVVATAEDIVRDASRAISAVPPGEIALGAALAPGSAGGLGGPGAGITIGTVNVPITVGAGATAADGITAGQAAGAAFVDEIRSVVMGA